MDASGSESAEKTLSAVESSTAIEEEPSGNFIKVFDEALRLIEDGTVRHEQVFWERSAFVHMYYVEPIIRGQTNPSLAVIEPCLKQLKAEGITDPDRAIPYLKQRAENTTNPFYKAKFSFTLWHLARRPEYADSAVRAYVDCASKQLSNKQYADVYTKLNTARFIARTPGYEGTRKYITAVLLPLSTGLAGSGNYGLCLLVLRMALSLYADVSADDVSKLAGLATTASGSLKSMKELRLALEFLAVAGLLNSKGSGLAKETLQQIALMHEEEANKALSEGNASAMFFFYQAANAFQKSGDSAKYKEMLSKAANATSLIQYYRHEEAFELPNLEIGGTTPDETYQRLAVWAGVDPRAEAIERLAKLTAGANTLANTMVRVIESADYPVAIGVGEEFEKLESIIFWIVLEEARLCAAFADLEDKKKVDASSLTRFITSYDVIDDDLSALIAEGVSQHFDKKYIASCHVLLPQIEAILRRILVMTGVHVAKEEGGGIRSKELGGLLTDESVIPFLGPSFATYLYEKLADPKGLNQRNLALHGLLKSKHFNQNLSITCIYIILRLIALSKAKSVSPSPKS